MSETLTSEKKSDKFKLRRKVRNNETDDLTTWLSGLGFLTSPAVHVNGTVHPTAVVVVDFGTPLAEPTRLTSEQSAELIGQIRSVTKSLFQNREVNVRVQSDTSTGVWWSSVG